LSRVLVTGAAGFVGRILCRALAERGYVVRAAVRRPCSVSGAAEIVEAADLGAQRDWRELLEGVDCVIHAAGRAHVRPIREANWREYFRTNTLATENLAWAAADGGARRFVYVSSVKVNGEETKGSAFRATDEPAAQDIYGISKWLGEQAVLRVAGRTRMQAIVIRSPLVYGPGVRGNFLRLMRLIDRGIPLPLANISNARSLVNVWNLCDLLTHVLETGPGLGRIWMVSDGEDLSTPELIRRLARAMRRRPRLLAVPPGALRGCARVMGREAEYTRLCGSLVVDASETRRGLEWQPPVSVDEGIERTVAWYAEGAARHDR